MGILEVVGDLPHKLGRQASGGFQVTVQTKSTDATGATSKGWGGRRDHIIIATTTTIHVLGLRGGRQGGGEGRGIGQLAEHDDDSGWWVMVMVGRG